MSAATATAAPVHVSSIPETAHVSGWRVVVAEWIKFLSLRSNVIALAGSVVAVVGFGALTAGVVSGSIVPEGPAGVERADLASLVDHTTAATAGVMLAILVLGTLGVTAMSGEFSSGMIRATLGAVPRRLPVLWGKVVVLVVVTTVVTAVSVFAAFAVSGWVLADSGVAAGLSDPGVLRALWGNVGYTVGVVLLGLALGALLRSTAGGIATLFVSLLVVPQLITLILPDGVVDTVYRYLPSSAATSFISVDPSTALAAQGRPLLDPGAGALVFAAWVVVLIAGAAISLRHRDA